MLKQRAALHTAQAFTNKDYEAFYLLKDVLYFHRYTFNMTNKEPVRLSPLIIL